MLLQSVAEIHNSFLLAFGYSRWLVSKGAFLRWKFSPTPPHFRPLFLLIVETLLWRLVICDLFVNSQKDGCLLVFFVGYLLRGLFQSRRFGLKNYNSITSFSPMLRNRRSRCLPSVGHLFQDHFQLQALPLLQSFVLRRSPMDQCYFNQAATSTIFSKNFSTNFFFGLLLGRFRWLVSRGTIFRKP